MIGQYLLAAAAGGALTAIAAVWMHKAYSTKAMRTLRAEAQQQTEALARHNASLRESVEQVQRENAALAALENQLRAASAEQSAAAEALRAQLVAASAERDRLASEATQIAGEAARLRALASTFERWHEQMISLMAQNRDMHEKNAELSAIVRHVVIVSLNASIEAARAGVVGRGFAVVAAEVRALAARSEALSKSYSESLHRNDLTTTATFQDIQAGGKMITAALSSVEALATAHHSQRALT